MNNQLLDTVKPLEKAALGVSPINDRLNRWFFSLLFGIRTKAIIIK